MGRQVTNNGIFAIDRLCMTMMMIIIVTMQVACAIDNYANSKDFNKEPKHFYGLKVSRDKKPSSLLDDEGLRFKKGSSLLDDEGMRFKKSSYLEDEGLRFKKPSDIYDRNAIIRKSVLDGEGLRFKKGSSLLDDEGMRFRRSGRDRMEESFMGKRYGFPGRLFSFYPFTFDQGTSYERRSDRSGNRDILEGEGMRF
ncbi:hypothetical protein RDWZM_007427 [Blomia tropicalis]|uniref:Uncharacterized protein n=1 Tax=Blomia tropicalis TaxID=40697 RepID=A0A9Q0LZ54_BLOTA|nr:hypothetical protein BLOT_015992 [Blomia tropicalis]KAJ6216270.1 hypothetical protein RDWZM_007427 [Blomia tropicalis]